MHSKSGDPKMRWREEQAVAGESFLWRADHRERFWRRPLYFDSVHDTV
jgi:hypothetical protein